MRTRSRIVQDKRKFSRLETRLDCQFDFEGTRYNAVISELSLKGAFISSELLPPEGSSVTVTIQSGHLSRPLILEGQVRRSSSISGRSKLGRFGIEVNSPPLDLATLISNLIAKKRAY